MPSARQSWISKRGFRVVQDRFAFAVVFLNAVRADGAFLEAGVRRSLHSTFFSGGALIWRDAWGNK